MTNRPPTWVREGARRRLCGGTAAGLLAVLLGGLAVAAVPADELWRRYEEGANLLETGGLDRIDAALALFDGVIAENPDFENVYQDAAEACLLQFELRARHQPAWLDRAERYARSLLEVQADSAEAHVLLAKIHGDRGAAHQARYHVLRAIALDPGLIEARLIRLAMLIRDNQAEDALAFAEETSAYLAGEPALFKQMALMLLPLNRPKAVRRYLALAMDGGLWDAGIIKAMAVTHAQENRHSEAAHLFARAAQENPDDTETLLQAAYCHARAGAFDFAAWFMQAYLKQDPANAEAAARLADYQAQLKKPSGGKTP